MRAQPLLSAQQHVQASDLPPPTPVAAARRHVAAAGRAPAAAGRASCRHHASSHAAQAAASSSAVLLVTEAQHVHPQQQHDSARATVQQPLGFVHVGGVVRSRPSQHNARDAPPPGPRSCNKQRQWAAVQVTRRIKECSSWQQVDAVVQTHGPTFNIINASAALSHLAQLKQQQEQQQHPLPPRTGLQQQQQPSDNQQQVWGLHAVTSQMEQQHQQAGVAQQLHSQQQLVAQLLRLALPLLDQAGSRQIGNMLWAAAVLGLPATSTAAASALLQRGLQLRHGAEAQHLSHMALAAAKLRLPVDGASLQQLQQAWLGLMRQERQQERLAADAGSSSSSSNGGSSSSNGGSSSSAHSAEHLVAAGNGVSNQAAATTSSRSSSITPQAMCNLLWAVVQLQPQQQPQQQQQQQRSWLQEVMAAAAPQLGSWPGKSVAMLLWAAARLGYQQPGSGVQQQEQQDGVASLLPHAMQQHAATLSVQDLSQCLWAAAAMKLTVPRSTLEHLLREGSRQLQQQQLKQGRPQQPKQQHGLADRPLRAGSKTAAESASWLAQHPPSAQLAHSTSLLLWSVAQLSAGQRQPSSDVLRPWLQVLAGAAPAASHTSLGVAAWALCKLGERACCPSLVLALLTAANKRAPEQQQGGGSSVSSVSSELAVASKEESAGLVVSLVWAAATCVRAAAPTQQQQQSRSTEQHKQQAGGRLQPRAAPAPAAPPLGSAVAGTDEHCVDDVRAAARQLLLHQQIAACPGEVLPRASLRQLAMLLWACCQLPLHLPEAWWRDCLSQLDALLAVQQEQLAGMQRLQAAGQSLALCVWALGKQRVLVPRGLMARLQQASLAVLQQQQQQDAGVLAPEGCAQLLLGFTRLATTAGWQLPRQSKSHQHPRSSSAAAATLLQPQQQQACWPTAAGVSDAWLRCFCAAAEGSLAASGRDSLVGTLWALGRLRYHPGHAFIAAAQRRALELLPGLGPRHIAVLLWAHARLRAAPHPRLVRAWERQLASADTPDQQQAGWALREVGVWGGEGSA